MARFGFWKTGFSADPRDAFPFVLPEFPASGGVVFATFQEAFDFVWRWSSMGLAYNVDIDDGVTVTNSSGVIGSANSPVPIVNERDIGCHGFLIQAWTSVSGSDSILGTLILNGYDAGTGKFTFLLTLQITNASGTISTGFTSTLGPSVSIFGNLIPMYVSGGAVSASGTVSIGVFEYYPYRDSLGNNPIWDVSTGAQLIFPLPQDAG